METIIGSVSCQNIGGYKAVYIADIETVKSINMVDDSKSAIVLNSGQDFTKIEMFDISLNSEPNGDAWNHTIAGLIRTADSLNAILNRLSKKRYIAKVIDNNNIAHLFGSIEEPLRFSFIHAGPPDPFDDKNYGITISGTTSETQRQFA